MTNKYPRIKELGLKICEYDDSWDPLMFVGADDLERILEKGHEIFNQYGRFDWHSCISESTNRKGLVINIQPYTKPDPREEKLKELESKLQGLLKEIEGMRG